MRRTNAILLLTLSFSPPLSFALDRKEPRSLAAEAAYLADKSGKYGWVSNEVAVSMEDGKKTAKRKLRMGFGADKDKPTGSLVLSVEHGTRVTVLGTRTRFELVERDGKRFIKVLEAKPDPTDTDLKVLVMLEYTLKAAELTVKGGVVRQVWGGGMWT